ncbi:1904_t:CDS:2 [Acaulospora colombiana]|uniref:1904_t:CDS:1 n=1 Tax=Acaulospora colombiana TaxID=27376 RepID=A0ACA9M413_9GLOM|nr:1904_t:CDS:2 [Acaulospora colombiana]
MMLETYRSPLRLLPGPPSDSIFLGNILTFTGDDPQEAFYGWQQTYGHVFAFTAFLGVSSFPSHHGCTLYIPFIHTISSLEEPEAARYQLSELLGDGFNYDFNTLQVGEEGNELAAAFHAVTSPKKTPLLFILKGFFPFLRPFAFDEQSRNNQKARRIMRDIGVKLIAEKGREPLEDRKNSQHIGAGKKCRDKLSEEQLLDQIPTFLAAGHETTATGLAWCLFSLGQDMTVQGRLREELLQAFPDDSTPITMEALNSLPYLDAVVRETLRLNPPLDGSIRVAMQDDIVPLEKPFVQADGKEVDHLRYLSTIPESSALLTFYRVKKGDHWIIPILNINRSKEIWGDDCLKFNPDRWLHELPPAAAPIPALWSNIMTFLGGPRACIGYRFAILERRMKAILQYLIRAFEFELPVDPHEITHKSIPRQRISASNDHATCICLRAIECLVHCELSEISKQNQKLCRWSSTCQSEVAGGP